MGRKDLAGHMQPMINRLLFSGVIYQHKETLQAGYPQFNYLSANMQNS